MQFTYSTFTQSIIQHLLNPLFNTYSILYSTFTQVTCSTFTQFTYSTFTQSIFYIYSIYIFQHLLNLLFNIYLLHIQHLLVTYSTFTQSIINIYSSYSQQICFKQLFTLTFHPYTRTQCIYHELSNICHYKIHRIYC